MPISLRTRPAAIATPQANSTIARSQAERLWLIGGGLTAVLLLLLGYFVAISPQRAQTSKVDANVSAANVQNGLLQQRIDALRQQNKNLAHYQAELAASKLALPSDSGVSDFLRSLQSLGTQTGTNVTSLTVGTPTDVTAALTTAPAVPAASRTSGAAAAQPSSAAPAAPTGPHVFALPISAQVSGPPASLNKFLEQLQHVQPRAVLVTQITETDGTTTQGAHVAAGGSSLQVTMQAFVAPTP